jgi:hypothetical protein
MRTKRRNPAELDDAGMRFERGEGVVRDLRRRTGDAGDERGLARVRETDETHVGDEFEFEKNAAGFALAGLPRSASGIGSARA